MKTGHRKRIMILAVVAFFISYSFSAFAYSLSSTIDTSPVSGTLIQVPSFNFDWTTNIMSNLSGSFQGLTRGGISTFSIGNIGKWTPQSAWQGFDGWLYGVAGFHIVGFWTAICGVLVWVLNCAKNIIEWLLSFLH